jgi:hypothetical protein
MGIMPSLRVGNFTSFSGKTIQFIMYKIERVLRNGERCSPWRSSSMEGQSDQALIKAQSSKGSWWSNHL